MVAFNFNAQDVSPNASLDPIPNNWYDVMIDESEIRPTKAQTGHYLRLRLKVLGGEYANRLLFVNLNIDNPNTVAQQIAEADLSAICHVTGVIALNDSQQLHGIPFKVRVVVKEGTGEYSASNEVKGYRNQHGKDPKEALQAGANAPQAPAPAAPPPTAPPSPQAGPARPTDPTHISNAGTPDEMWWDGAAWIKPPAPVEQAAPAMAPPPTPAPAPAAAPPVAPPPAAAPAPQAVTPPPPPAQPAPAPASPTPAAPAAASGGTTPPWA